MGSLWRRLDEWDQHRGPHEGLRERKKRETRQRVSDVATALFLARGYDNVRVSEIADKVGVSEKTIYIYFPTKEALVYDQAEEQLLKLAAALRDRPAGTSPTVAVAMALKADIRGLSQALPAGEEAMRIEFLKAFSAMIHDTPALRAAWGEHRHNMVEAFTALLAQEAGVDPTRATLSRSPPRARSSASLNCSTTR
jgi:AcrR family transcriptional regulator